MTTRACTKCGVVKPLAAFHKDKTGKFGIRADCKECVAAYTRAYRDANGEKIASRNRAHYDANREKIAAHQRAYAKDNREKIAARKRAYRESNREKISARKRAHYELIGAPTADKWQEISLKHATRKREPWSEEEDRYLANSTARVIDDALALQRTFNSVKTRRRNLHRAGVIEKQSA